jgi:multidrug efflux pump subunit AcrA (membrane-fusion protein)
MDEPSARKALANDQTWRRIEGLVDEISGLAKSCSSTQDFYAAMLERAVEALAALGGAVWTGQPDEQLRIECQRNLPQTLLSGDDPRRQLHTRLLGSVLSAGQSRVVPPDSACLGVGHAPNPTDSLLVLSPVLVEDQAVAVVEIFQRPDAPPSAQPGFVRVLEAMCELAADFHRNRELAELRGRQAVWRQAEQFAESVHSSLDLDATAYAIANDGRQLIGCDRVSVLVIQGRKCRLRAVSGLDAFDRRATLARRMEQLAQTVLAASEPLWNTGNTDDLAPVLAEAVQSYLDESHSRMLAVLPLKARSEGQGVDQDGETIGALVIERFQGTGQEAADAQRASVVCRHGAPALKHAIWRQRLPLLPLLRLLAGVPRLAQTRRARFLALLLAGSLLAAALAVAPADFEVEARGSLQPKRRRDVFAPSDGVVQKLYVEHADRVSAGQALFELRRSELDFEFARVLGEMETARKQLDSVAAARLRDERTTTDARQQYEQLTAKEEELKKLLESLAQQREILLQQRSELTVVSPMDGQILTWNVKQTLDARPVQRGQVLATVADPGGPWVLELRVPDDQIGYVLAAQRQLGPHLGVSFILATDPAATHQGRIEKTAMDAQNLDGQEATVLVTVQIDREQLPPPRPGATVAAKIHCGRRPLAYVWFHDLIEAVRSRLMF